MYLIKETIWSSGKLLAIGSESDLAKVPKSKIEELIKAGWIEKVVAPKPEKKERS